MPLSLKPKHISRYRDIARLLMKYGRSDLLNESGLDTVLTRSDRAAWHRGANGTVVVHEHSGEILEKQVAAEAERTEQDPALPGAKAAPKLKVPASVKAMNAAKNGAKDSSDRAAELADDLEAMGLTYVKVGQFLSTRADLLPVPYLDALTRLQDRVLPFPYEEVERIVNEELGVKISKAFASFEREPVASASTGQVHRAELRSGMIVAVKVQRPGVQDEIPKDLEVLAEIADFLDHRGGLNRYDFTGTVEELRKSLLRELDYRQEAKNLLILGENLAEFEHIIVPSPVADYVTPRLLTMEFIHGRKVTALGPLAKMEVDGEPLAEELCHAYLKQIMVDGFFHADPHPGNVFLTDDGRLAMIDLGMVGQLSPNMQEDLLKLILAISEGRGEDAGDVIINLGTPLPDAHPEGVRRRVAEMVLGFKGLRLREIALGRLLFDATRSAALEGYRMPRELTLVGKALLNVDEVARRLDPEFDPNAAIRRQASHITHQRMLKVLSPGTFISSLLEAKKFAENLPRRLNQVMEALAENRLKINVDAIDEVILVEGMQKIANRITIGVIISAMIVGAALMMRIPTSFTILGYPGLAILFFFAAAIGGALLVGDILIYDLRSAKAKRSALKQKSQATPPH